MKITVSGVPGSGKSTLARSLARKLDYKHYSVGDKMRKIAKEKGISVIELNELAKKDPSIDRSVDQWQKRLGEESDDFVLDGRLSFHFVPDSIKIFLDCDENIAAGRIYNRKLPEERTTVENILNETRERVLLETKRYQDFYNVNYLDRMKFDFVIDSTNLSMEEVLDMVFEYVKEFI